MAKTWVVNVKWDGSNNVDEASRLMELSLDRGRKALIRSGGNGFTPQDVGECVLTFRNTDGRYDPLNASSALYPNVAPGKQVTITLTDGATYAMFRGHIYDIKPVGNAQSRKVQIIVRDGWQWLSDRKITSAPQANIGTHTAMATVLTAAAYPFATSIATGEDTIPYWWADNQDAMHEIQSVADSEFGILYAAGDGTLTFQARSAQWNTASSVTFQSTDLNELSFAQPWDVIRNVIQIKVYPTDIFSDQVLWASTKPFKLRPTKALTLNVKYTYEGNPTSAQNIAAMVANVHYQAFENANGTGANLTANIGVVVTAKGEEASIALTNNSATRLAYITLLQLRGDVINRGDAVTVEADASGGSNRRTFLLDVPWQQDVETAQEYAKYLAGLFDNARGNPTLRTNRDTAKQCLDLGAVFTLDVSTLGINNAYRVEGLHHAWNAQSPNVLNTRIFGGNKDETSYFILDQSLLDGPDVLAY